MVNDVVFEKQDAITKSGIHYRVTRSSDSVVPLVLIYGYGGNIGMWPVVFIEHLAKKYVVVCLDNRGVGQSICPLETSSYSVPIMANDVDDVVRTLELTSFHLLGYSLGGCIALQYAHQHSQKLKSLFLLSTTGGSQLWTPPIEDHVSTLSAPPGETLWDLYMSVWRTTMGEATLLKQESALRELFDNSKEYPTPNEALAGHVHAFKTFDSSAFLGDLSIPTTIFTGENDRLVRVENSVSLAELIPRSKLIKVADCEHYPQIECPELLLSEITNLCELAH